MEKVGLLDRAIAPLTWLERVEGLEACTSGLVVLYLFDRLDGGPVRLKA